MSFLTPAALALSALAIPILLLWMLRLRRPDVTVSSTLLWRRLVRDREANVPWQKLRRNLLLLLQLATLAALVLALARPYLPVPAVTSGAAVVLLDASASMSATDVEPSRFAVAQRAAERMVGKLSGGSVMTVILAGQRPRALAAATKDKAVLREAISAARSEQGPADWPAALALAAAAARGAAESTVVIISDGNLPDGLPPLPGEVRYIPVGREGGTGNQAITALAARDGVSGPELFVNIADFCPPGSPARESLVSVYLDGALYDSRNLTISPGENLPLTFTGLPAGAAVIEARLTIDDSLALDDRAWAVRRPGGERRALVVTDGNLFLERAVAALPQVTAFRADPGAPLPADTYDLYVYDGTLPAAAEGVPQASLLVINPAPGNSLLTVTGTFSNTRPSTVSNDPLLTHVDFSQVQILKARAVLTPDWARPLVSAEGGPLLLVGERDGRRIAVLTFDLHHSDLPLQVAFPVLMANLVEWLTPGQPFDAGDGLRPGESLSLLGAAGTSDAPEVRIIKPDGSVWTPQDSALAQERSRLVFAETEQLGLYQVEIAGSPAGQFAVNLFDPVESSLSRQEAITIGRAEVPPAGEQELGQRELWPWLAAGALILLLIEWWVYHRGARLPEPGRPQ